MKSINSLAAFFAVIAATTALSSPVQAGEIAPSTNVTITVTPIRISPVATEPSIRDPRVSVTVIPTRFPPVAAEPTIRDPRVSVTVIPTRFPPEAAEPTIRNPRDPRVTITVIPTRFPPVATEPSIRDPRDPNDGETPPTATPAVVTLTPSETNAANGLGVVPSNGVDLPGGGAGVDAASLLNALAPAGIDADSQGDAASVVDASNSDALVLVGSCPHSVNASKTKAGIQVSSKSQCKATNVNLTYSKKPADKLQENAMSPAL